MAISHPVIGRARDQVLLCVSIIPEHAQVTCENIESILGATNIRMGLARLFRLTKLSSLTVRVACSLFETISCRPNHRHTAKRYTTVKMDNSLLQRRIDEKASPRIFSSGP
jgi:hypothetical protein